MRCTMFRFTLLLGVSLVAAQRSAAAQSVMQPLVAPAAACGYERCALTIAPTWSGLALERGATHERVANLYFLWPRDISAVLARDTPFAAGSDSVVASAHRAVRLRRIGAVLTDASLALAASAALGASRGASGGRWDRRLVGLAGAALVVSVPFQFAADGALSRSVWWYNRRFAH